MIHSVAITGAGSPIGKSLCNQISAFKDVQVLKVSSGKRNKHDLYANISEPGSAADVFEDLIPQTVIHLSHAPISAFDGNEGKYKSLNKEFALRLAESAYGQGCKRFIFASSSAIYGDKYYGAISETAALNPNSIYAESKAEIEEALIRSTRNTELKVCSARIFNVFGQGLNNSFINKLLNFSTANFNEKLLMLGPDNFIRDYIHVSDLSNVMSQLVASKVALPNYVNIGTGIPTTNNDLLKFIPLEKRKQINLLEAEFSSSVANISVMRQMLKYETFFKIEDEFPKTWI